MLVFPSRFSRTALLSAFARRGLVLSGLALGIGCGDYECKEDESYCDGNVARTCDYSREEEMSRWKDDDCGRLTCTRVGGTASCATREGPDPRCEGTDTSEPPAFCFQGSVVACAPSGHAARRASCAAACVESDDTATCTQSSEPDPLCGDADEACDGNVLIQCEQGYRTLEFPCADGLSNGEYCIESGPTAFCAASPEPDPLCTTDTVCDGGSKLYCREGYPLRSQRCDTALCVTTTFGPTCVFDAEYEPACADVVAGKICDGNFLLECLDGYVTSRTPCDEGTCHAFPDDASCVISGVPDPNCQETRQLESYCDGDSVVHCEYGYPTRREPCGSDQHCFKNDFSSEAQCWDG